MDVIAIINVPTAIAIVEQETAISKSEEKGLHKSSNCNQCRYRPLNIVKGIFFKK